MDAAQEGVPVEPLSVSVVVAPAHNVPAPAKVPAKGSAWMVIVWVAVAVPQELAAVYFTVSTPADKPDVMPPVTAA